MLETLLGYIIVGGGAMLLVTPIFWWTFVVPERKRAERAEGREHATRDALKMERSFAAHEAALSRARIERLEAEIDTFYNRDTIPNPVPTMPRRAKTDTLVSE